MIKKNITELEIGDATYHKKGHHWVNRYGFPVPEKTLVRKIKRENPDKIWWASEECLPVTGKFDLSEVLM